MISTSSHKNCKSEFLKTYDISGNGGKNANYKGKCFKALAPKKNFWKIWHDNIGILPEEKNNKYYIEQYYNQVLSLLDPEETYRELDYSILLCYEDSNQFCHRHIVAAWFEIYLNIKVPEIKVDGLHIEQSDRPDYILDYLEDVIKSKKNMRGFNSIRALYLLEKGENLENKANEEEQKTGKSFNHYRQMACYYRCDADEEEAKYNKLKQEKTKVLSLKK